jgi:hypothetical protein
LGDCITSGAVSVAELKIAGASFLANSDPISVSPDGVWAMLPMFDDLPLELQNAFIEIALRARV